MNNEIRNIIFREGQNHDGNIVRAATALADKMEGETAASLLLKFGNDNTGKPAINLLPTNFWVTPDLDEIRESHGGYTEAEIIQHKTKLGKFVKSLCDSIQFPVNTAYAHALGCVAVATSKQFTFDFFKKGENKPVNLYVVTSQPPSSGKSAIHSALLDPVHKHYKKINMDRAVERRKVERQIDELEDSIKKDKGSSSEFKEEKIVELQEELKNLNRITVALSDSTPEALEKAAIRHNGMVNVASDEAEALTVLLGSVYSDRKANSGMILKAWDKDWTSVERTTREGMEGYVWGTIAVIAQDEAIDSLLEAGKLGRGVPERFLMMREKPLMGARRYDRKFKPVDSELEAWYDDLIESIVTEEKTTLSFDDDAFTLVMEYKQKIEKTLGDGGPNSNSMLRGSFGKADKQICRLACLHHVIQNWGSKGKKSKVVSAHSVAIGMQVFEQFGQALVDSTTNNGVAGNMALMFETAKVLRELRDEKKKGSVFGINVLRQSSAFRRKGSIFSNTPELTTLLRNTILPALHEEGVIAFDGDKMIAINPNY